VVVNIRLANGKTTNSAIVRRNLYGRELELTMAQVRNWFAESFVPFPSQVLDDVRQGDVSLRGADYCSSAIC
jgi:hypothetical protein